MIKSLVSGEDKHPELLCRTLDSMAIWPAQWLGLVLLVSVWGSSAPGRRRLRVRQGFPCGLA